MQRRKLGESNLQTEGSLRRLGVETIHLYYQHRVDPREVFAEADRKAP